METNNKLNDILETQASLRHSFTSENDDYYGGWGGLLDAIGVEILQDENIGDYQGDEIYLLRMQNDSGHAYGFFVGGYGSCEGCDGLMGISHTEANEQAEHLLLHDIHWCLTANEMIAHLDKRDGANSWYYNEPEWKDVFENFVRYLRENTGGYQMPLFS